MNYKCTHNYPGGPSVGYISKPHKVQPETDKDCHYYNHNWFNPEDFPEYWEPVIEKKLSYGAIGYPSWIPTNSYNPEHYADIASISWFNTEAERDLFLEDNRPQFSKKELKTIANNFLDNYIKYGKHTVIDFDKWLKEYKK